MIAVAHDVLGFDYCLSAASASTAPGTCARSCARTA
ncbi:hypothetical protein L559_2228, partial [Bordetella pertussis STO1-CHOC-0017]